MILLFFSKYGNTQVSIPVTKPNQDKITQKQFELIFKNSKAFPVNTQLSIALIENGNVKFYGIERINDTTRTVHNSESVFEIGSITKVFTSSLLANFVIGNKIKLDNPIQDYLDLHIKSDKKITLKQLSNHTSGLPRLPANLNLFLTDQTNPYKDYHEERLKEYLSKGLELSGEPGGKYEYSNTGAGLLGYILSKKENSNFNDLLKKFIFSKYNMTSSTTQRKEIASRLVKGLDPQGSQAANWDMNVLVGAGGILSTVNDLTKFALAQIDTTNKELVLTRTPTFSVNQNMDVSLGWHIIKTRSNDRWFWHNGGTGGYSSSMAIDVEKKNGIIILSNVSAFNPNMGNIDKLCFELMKSLSTK